MYHCRPIIPCACDYLHLHAVPSNYVNLNYYSRDLCNYEYFCASSTLWRSVNYLVRTFLRSRSIVVSFFFFLLFFFFTFFSITSQNTRYHNRRIVILTLFSLINVIKINHISLSTIGNRNAHFRGSTWNVF